MFPAVPTSVTVGADIPSWTYDFLRRFHRRTRSWLILVSPPPASALVLADSALAVLPRAAALLHPFECHCHPSLVLRRPSGYCRRPAAVPLVVSCSTTSRLGPSHGVSLPSAVASTKDPVFCPGTSTSPAVASSGFLPSRRLDPLRAFPTFLPGPLLGLLPSGLYSSRRSGFSFENSEPSWLCLT